MPFSTQSNQTVIQGTGAGAAVPWSVELSDGAAFYTGAKTGQFPTTLGQTTKTASLSVALASDQVGSAGSAAANVLSVQGIASMTPIQVSQATASNLNAAVVGTGSPGTAAGGVLSVQGVSGGSNLNVAQATASALNATVVQATASSLNATVVGGAANAAAVSGNPVLVAGYDGTNARTIRTDSSGSIYAAGGSSYNTNGVNETRTVRTGAGVLIRLVINPGTSSTFVCYDNTAGSGTVLCALTTGSAGGNGYSVEVGATFSTGLTYVSTGGCNVTLVYRAF